MRRTSGSGRISKLRSDVRFETPMIAFFKIIQNEWRELLAKVTKYEEVRVKEMVDIGACAARQSKKSVVCEMERRRVFDSSEL